MKRFRIHLELNRGRHGVPLAKLAAVQQDLLKFLNSLSADLQLHVDDDQWLADRFENGSYLCDIELSEDLAAAELGQLQDTFEALLQSKATERTLRLSTTTRARFVKIWSHLDADEIALMGVYRDDAVAPELFELRQLTGLNLVGGLIDRNEYGEIQGVVHSFITGVEKPYIVIRELSTNEKVNCFFRPDQYQAMVELLKDRRAVVFVEGWLRLDPETQFVKRIQVEYFRPAPEFSLQRYQQALGSMPDYVVESIEEDSL